MNNVRSNSFIVDLVFFVIQGRMCAHSLAGSAPPAGGPRGKTPVLSEGTWSPHSLAAKQRKFDIGLRIEKWL